MHRILSAAFIMITSASLAVAHDGRQLMSHTDTIRGPRLVRDADKVLDWRDTKEKEHTDSSYMMRAPERIRLIFRLNSSGSSIEAEGNTEQDHFKSSLSANNRYTVSAGASYRGLTLALSVNPARLAGKNKDYEFNMNAYGNRFGADIIFQSANTFRGTIENSQGTTDVPAGLVRQNMLNVNTYYVLNNKRFSLPAAFSQSWIQKRSSGSLIGGISFMGGNLRVSASEDIGNQASRLSMANIGIGIGYGYNWIIRKKWLLHVSTLPQIVVYSNCRTTVNEEKVKTPYKFPNIIAVGRVGLIRHFDRYYAGLTGYVTTSSIGDMDKMRLTTVKWHGRLTFGIKL